MDYRVEELAGAAGLPVDTIRFYQARGLLPSPRRVGRTAIYDETHLERLRRIRSLLSEAPVKAVNSLSASWMGINSPCGVMNPSKSSVSSPISIILPCLLFAGDIRTAGGSQPASDSNRDQARVDVRAPM